jgi:hypothetical protein
VERITPKEVDCMLRQQLRHRSDLGLWNALAARIIEPQNPFEIRSRRKPQRWCVLFVMSAFSAVAAFIYFNLWN